MAGEPAEDSERGLGPLTAHPVQRPDEHDLEAPSRASASAWPSISRRLALLLLAASRAWSISPPSRSRPRETSPPRVPSLSGAAVYSMMPAIGSPATGIDALGDSRHAVPAFQRKL